MNAPALFGDRRMTVKEVAEALGTAESTIRNKAGMLFSEFTQNGKSTLLTEAQVHEIKKSIVPRDLTLKSKVDSAVSALDIAEMTLKVITYHKDESDRLRAELAIVTPKAALADRIADATGLRTISDVGKINRVGPRKIFEVLEDRGIIFRGGDARWRPYQTWIDAGYFEVKESTYDTLDGPHLSVQTYVTGRGELWLAKRLFTEATT